MYYLRRTKTPAKDIGEKELFGIRLEGVEENDALAEARELAKKEEMGDWIPLENLYLFEGDPIPSKRGILDMWDKFSPTGFYQQIYPICVFTHDGVSHLDEMAAVAAISVSLDVETPYIFRVGRSYSEIVEKLKEENITPREVWVVDMLGGIEPPEADHDWMVIDHHHKDFPSESRKALSGDTGEVEPLQKSSISLTLEELEYWGEISGEISRSLKEKFASIEAADNGQMPMHKNIAEDFLRKKILSGESPEENFWEGFFIFRDLIKDEIDKEKDLNIHPEGVREVVAPHSPGAIFRGPFDFKTTARLSYKKDFAFFVHTDINGEDYVLRAIPKPGLPKSKAIPIPKELGDKKETIFVHKNGFLAKFKSEEAALAAARELIMEFHDQKNK